VVTVYTIVSAPAETPLITADGGLLTVPPTVASAVLLLLHVPPLVVSCKVTVVPAQIALTDGVIAPGTMFTVTMVDVVQPEAGSVYTMVAVPTVLPSTLPVAEPTVTCELELLQLPPDVPSVKVIVELIHTLDGPDIEDGKGLIETVTLPCGPQQPADDCAAK